MKVNLTHESNKFDVTFIGCSERFKYGIVAKEKNRIIGFERDVEFNSINKKNNQNLIGHAYSGISILNSELLKINFKNFSNFEKKFYPKIIKKNKSNFEEIEGFWFSIDNEKDINNLNLKANNPNYNEVRKIKINLKKYG